MEDTTTGVTAPAAGGQSEAPSEAPATNVTVPLHVVQTVRQELASEKAARADVEQRLQLFMMQGQQQPPQQQAPPPEDPLAGMQDDELINVKDLRKLVSNMRPGITPEIQTTIAKLEAKVQDPNYEATIRTYLPDMITAQPTLRDMIARAPNPLHAALTVAKMSPKYQEAQKQPNAPRADILNDLQRIIENATKPMSPGSMGGGGAVAGHDRFRTMSDQDFEAEVQRVLSGR